MLNKSLVLTPREIDVIDKKLENKKLSQQDSNYLSRYVRPKLRELREIDADYLLRRLEYNQKIPAIEKSIKSLILKNIKNVSSITLYGSAVYSNYNDYKDIDVLVSVQNKFWKKLGEKYKLIVGIKKKTKLALDIKIFTDKQIYDSYPDNITLIYELKDIKTIYGRLPVLKQIKLSKPVLKYHLDYSYLTIQDINDYGLEEINSRELYSAIRNLWVIRLITEKIIDNSYLIRIMNLELGKNLVDSLKNNTSSSTQKKIAYLYLDDLYKQTEKLVDKITEIKWEKNQSSNHW